MKILIIFFLLSTRLSSGIADKQSIVCVQKDIHYEMINLTCTSGTFASDIEIKYPSEKLGAAYCYAPSISNDSTCQCSCKSTPSCSCDISQGITMKTTTLVIRSAELSKMYGTYTCRRGLLVESIEVDGSNVNGDVYSSNVHLSGEIKEMKEYKKFTLHCFSCGIPYTKSAYFYVNDVLEDNVRYSNKSCYHKKKACHPSECSCSMEGNQFTWSFISSLSYMEFSCGVRFKDEITSKRSFQTASIIYNGTVFEQEVKRTRTITDPDNDIHITSYTSDENCIHTAVCEKNDRTPYIVSLTMSITVTVIAVVISILICCFPYIPGKLFNCISNYIIRRNHHYDLLQSRDDIDCATCNAICTCALCVDCKSYYCDVCCVHHREMNYDHIMFSTQQIAVNQRKVDCNSNKCSKTAERFCISCWKPFCTLCSRKGHCKDMKIIIIYQAHSRQKQHKSGEVQNKLISLHNVFFQDDKNPVRVCGMAFLVDGTVVVIDGNNDKFIVFKSKKEHSLENNKLPNEPNSITAINGNKFAVTYPSQRYIQLCELTYDTIQSIYRVSFLDTINTSGKPFSIAHNQLQGIFAVEIGERDDGRICIIDVNEKTIMKTLECHFAFFTGHTIRLALGQNRIFVSAMGKRIVSCMDFDGNKLWHQSVPGPRAIIVYEDCSSSEKIMLASKKCNAIYELKKEGDHHKILKATDKITSPRYMAYNSVTKTLCVLVGNDRTHKDELEFFKFENAEPEESTSPSEEIPLQNL